MTEISNAAGPSMDIPTAGQKHVVIVGATGMVGRFAGCNQHLQRRLFHTAEGVGRGDVFEALLLERGSEGRSLRRA